MAGSRVTLGARLAGAAFEDMARAIKSVGVQIALGLRPLREAAVRATPFAQTLVSEDERKAYIAFVCDGGDPESIHRVERAFGVGP